MLNHVLEKDTFEEGWGREGEGQNKIVYLLKRY